MRARLLVLLCLPAFAGPVAAQRPGCVGVHTLVHVDSISFWLDAPTGWVLECRAGGTEGPLTVLYRVGDSWQTGDPVMYATSLTSEDSTAAAFVRRVDRDVADWTASVRDASAAVVAPDTTGDGVEAVVRQLDAPSHNRYELVAYIPRGAIITMLVLSARSAGARANAVPSFREFVQSYRVGPSPRSR